MIQAMEPVRIVTARLVLRELRPEDLPAAHAYAEDPEVSRFEAWGPNTEEQTQSWLEAAIDAATATPRTQWTLAICEQADETWLLGACSLRIDAPNRSAHLGYVLHRSRWGRGYATEAARAVTRCGFEDLGLRRIAATCREENRASARVLEKVGLRLEGRMRSDVLIRGEPMDSRLYARLAGDPPSSG